MENTANPSRRSPSEQTKGEQDDASFSLKMPMMSRSAAEIQADLVLRANTLFRRLGIKARPIQNFEDLQRTASSMFVGIFEKMFNVDLKHAVRKPSMVAHYIKNAKIVIHALSEASDLDLSHLSAEEVYKGDPAHIETLITIFETFWEQLNEEFTVELERQLQMEEDVSGIAGELEEDSLKRSPRRQKKRKDGGRSKRKRPIRTTRVVHKDSAKENKRKQLQEIKERYTFRYPERKQQANKTKRKLKPKRPKKRQSGPGLEALAEKHPRLFQTLSLKKGSLLKSTLKRPRAKGPRSSHSALVNKLEADVVKYQKAYEMLLKQRLGDLRRETLNEINVGQLKRAGAEKTAKIEKLEAQRLQNDLQRAKKSEKMKTEAQEEVLLRRLLSDSMKHEHNVLLNQRKATMEAQKRMDKEQLDRYESLQNYLSNQQEIIKEELKKQQNEQRVDATQQKLTLEDLSRDLRAQFRKKMKTIESDWVEHSAKQRLGEKERLESIFADLDTFVSNAAAKNIRMTLTADI